MAQNSREDAVSWQLGGQLLMCTTVAQLDLRVRGDIRRAEAASEHTFML